MVPIRVIVSASPLFLGTSAPFKTLIVLQFQNGHIEGETSEGLTNAIVKASLAMPLEPAPIANWKLKEKPSLVLQVAFVVSVCCKQTAPV